ncbi:MAG: fasciclin domain-containing protein [Acidimicrobiales bacterium]
MLRLLTRKSLAGLLLVALIGAGCGDDDDDATTEPTQAQAPDATTEDDGSGDVLEVAAAEGDLTTFLAALEAAEIMDGLHGTGPFTVFIPTDAAFSAYLDEAGMSQAEVFADPAMLQKLLNHHIVHMTEDADMVMAMAGQSFETAAGTQLDVSVDGDVVMVGGATVERYDLAASNGVIHVIDDVLIPPGS